MKDSKHSRCSQHDSRAEAGRKVPIFWLFGLGSLLWLSLLPLNGQYTYHYYYSRDYGTANLRPRLVVTYTVGGTATPTPTPTASASACLTDANANGIVDIVDIMATAQTQACWVYLPLIAGRWQQPWSTPTPTPTPTATPTSTVESGTLDVPLTVRETAGSDRSDEPVTSGLPLSRSLNLTDLSTLRLLDSADQPVPAQFTPLARWGGVPDDPGKPVRWLLLDFQADVPAGGAATYRLVNSGGPAPTFPTLTVTDTVEAITVDTGAAQFSISKSDGRLTTSGLAAPLFGRARSGATVYTTTGPVTVSSPATSSPGGPGRQALPAVAGLRAAPRSGTTVPPLFAQAPPSWYSQSGALPFLSSRNFTDWPDYENYINYQLDTAPTYEEWMDWFPNLPAAIEGTDFYGIFDYGDVPLDYEGYGVSPMNPKYHLDYGMWMQWARGGDPRWFALAEAADRHIADVDILHNRHSPRHWGDGIMFGHSYHDESGFVNPHRNYGGNHPDTAFGLPGLLTTYYLTGYEKALEAALELADCIEYRLHNDSHLCSYFPDCSGEGYGLGSSDGLYEDSSRPAANTLWIAVAAYRATTDPRYLTVADALVDWARADRQAYIGGPIPGDGRYVKPWTVHMYLRGLAEYIEMRDEFNLPDTYNAAGSFLAYADWLRTYAWIDLAPIDTGPRGAYPYEWWFDDRAANDDPDINNWLLVGADALAYAHRLSGQADYLERAARLFRAGSRDPWYEGDANTYSATKETANGVTWGHVFLQEWAGRP